MTVDPDTFPTAEDEFFPEDDEYGETYESEPVAPEWTPGECDMCAGPPASHDERAAELASAIVPVCACWAGQGAPAGDCLCGPELFAGNAPEGRVSA